MNLIGYFRSYVVFMLYRQHKYSGGLQSKHYSYSTQQKENVLVENVKDFSVDYDIPEGIEFEYTYNDTPHDFGDAISHFVNKKVRVRVGKDVTDNEERKQAFRIFLEACRGEL